MRSSGLAMDSFCLQTVYIYGNDLHFEFAGDDDVWILLDDQKVILDLGGIHQAAQGDINFSTGEVRVSEEVVEQEDGTTEEVQTTGIYCIVGMEARFKPVEILYSGDGFVLVQPAASVTAEALKIRSGDEVIIAARDLYDGKVIGG